MKEDIIYRINKGINRPIEFRGLKAQYIYILAVGLAVLLVTFTIMYITGVPTYLCLPIVLIAGSGLFVGVYRYSHRYGAHGLMKATAFRRVPPAILCRSRAGWRQRLHGDRDKVSKNDSDHGTGRATARRRAASK